MTLRAQWEAMINRGIMPIFNHDLSNGDILTVNVQLEADDSGLLFNLDAWEAEGLEPYFSGAIEQRGHRYFLPFDEYEDSLDAYLAQLADEILEGYLVPNGLYIED